MLRLLDLRFANDILIFAPAEEEVENLVDSVMPRLAGAERFKKLGRMLRACLGQNFDVECHLQQAAKAFHKQRKLLQCKDCSIKHRVSKQVLRQQLVSLPSTSHYTNIVYRTTNMTFNLQTYSNGTSTRHELVGSIT